MSVISTLKARGFIENQTHFQELEAHLSQPGRHCYIGFDPTAKSLHVGHLIPIMALAHMQRCGHIPIALVGGGTGRIGDPSGKTEMRQMMSLETIQENVNSIKAQLSHFIDFTGDQAILANNADWLADLEYIPFLRDVGRHFSINKMIKAEGYKNRLASDQGLSFIEFNYMLLQAFDFLKLAQTQDCLLQMGGSDQWGNIVAGVELIRKTTRQTAFGMTFKLITKSDGTKMGKTAGGALWLDPEKTSPYDYFQFWMNTQDPDVAPFLSLFTFLPLDEIKAIESLSGSKLNQAKEILAFEATALAHGPKEALKARGAAASAFGTRILDADLLPSSTIPRQLDPKSSANLPTTAMDMAQFKEGIPAYQLFQRTGLCTSAGDARRLIAQGGGYINGNALTAFDHAITLEAFEKNAITLRAGKKRYHQIRLAPAE